MRVAVRRLRAMLRAARPMLDRAWVTALRDELEWLGDGLGAVRDLDVLLAYLVESAATLAPAERAAFAPLLERLRAERAGAQERVLDQLRDSRYLDLLDRLDAGARAPAVVDDDVSLVAIARRATRRLGKAVDGLDEEPSDEALHQVRIAAKRARYAAELAVEDAGKRAERFIRAAKRLQDLLGEHQAGVVAEQRLRALAPLAGGVDGGIALGRLLERQTERRRAARARFARVWRKLRRRGRAAWDRGR